MLIFLYSYCFEVEVLSGKISVLLVFHTNLMKTNVFQCNVKQPEEPGADLPGRKTQSCYCRIG